MNKLNTLIFYGLIFVANISAQTAIYGTNLSWNVSGATLTISGTGDMPDYAAGGAPWYNDRNTVTALVIESGVTGIGASAFDGFGRLTAATIPPAVTSVGYAAFAGCYSLTEMTMPFVGKSPAATGTEGLIGYMFGTANNSYMIAVSPCYDIPFPCNTYYLPLNLKKITITEPCTRISSHAFYGCLMIEEVTIPESITSIGIYAFNKCSELKTVYYNAINCITHGNLSVGRIIGSPAFAGCSNLTDIYFGSKVTRIPDGAFWECYGLKSMIIPETVTYIGMYAFVRCSSLTSITIPGAATSIGASAFEGCSNLTTVNFNAMNCTTGSFQGCSKLSEINFGKKVTKIPDKAFVGCSGINSVTIPETVTSIGQEAFYNCYGLISATIPNSVTFIGAQAFYGCSSLTSVTCLSDVPPSLTLSYGYSNVFPNRGADADLYVLPGCKAIYEAAGGWKDFRNIVELANEDVFVVGGISYYRLNGTSVRVLPSDFSGATLTIPAQVTWQSATYSVTSVGNYAFRGCSGLTTVTLPASVTSVGDYAFQNCSVLSSVAIPSATHIGSYAFDGCGALKSVTLPNATPYIADYAFYGSGVASLNIPAAVTQIGKGAFQNCGGLQEITIPEAVTYIGEDAFKGCAGLTTVHFNAVNCTTMGASRINSMTGVEESYNVFEGCINLSDITIGSRVARIPGSAFAGTGISTVTIPESVTSIVTWAFSNCSNLTTVNFNAVNCTIMGAGTPSNDMYATTWDYNVFIGCHLTEVNIGNKVTTIPGHAFYNQAELKDVPLPETVTSIGGYAFAYCRGITEIAIPESVTTIGDHAFAYCRGINEITIPEGVTNIDHAAFLGCTGLEIVNFNAINCKMPGNFSGMNEFYYSAFNDCSNLTKINIGSRVAMISDDAFNQCSALKEVTIPESVQSIGGQSFQNCAALESVTIGNSVRTIGSWAFYQCSSLREVTFGNSVRTIGGNAFQECSNLVKAILPESVTDIEMQAFYGCNRLTSVTLPSLLTTIKYGAFQDCIRLNEIINYAIIPQSITEGNVFANVPKGLCTLKVPSISVADYRKAPVWQDFENIEAMEDGVNDYDLLAVQCINNLIVNNGLKAKFYDPASWNFAEWNDEAPKKLIKLNVQSQTLTGAVSFAGLTTLQILLCGNNQFTGLDVSQCTALQELMCHNTPLTELDVSQCTALQRLSCILSGITELDVSRCTVLQHLSCSGNYLAELDVRQCTALQELYCDQNRLTELDLTGLNHLTEFSGGGQEISMTLYEIAASGYSCVINLNQPSFGNGVITYADGILKSTNNAASSVNFTTQTGKAGYTLSGVMHLSYKSAQPSCANPVASGTTGKLAWTLCPDGTLTINGAGEMPDYEWGESPWFSYNHQITVVIIENGVTCIGISAFASSNMKTVVIPESVTSVGNLAFHTCRQLTSVTIPPKVTHIGGNAFEWCSNLSSVMIPENVTYIGGYAFANCEKLTSIHVAAGNTAYISENGVLLNISKTELLMYPAGKSGAYTVPASVTDIADFAFIRCNNLTELIIPHSVTSVGYDAFQECNHLTSVTCFAINPPYISSFLSQDGMPNCTLYVPSGSVGLYVADEKWNIFGNIVGISVPTYAVTVTNGTGGGNYAAGATVSITAGTPPAGQQFKNWTANPAVTFANANSASTTFVMPANAVTVTAVFEDIPAGNVTVSGTVTDAPFGTEVQLYATNGGTTKSGVPGGYTYVASTTTNLAGYYCFEGLQPGVYIVLVIVEGKDSTPSDPMSLADGQTAGDVNFTVKGGTVTPDGLTGAEDIWNTETNLYPNPFTGLLHLTGAEGGTLRVFAESGAAVHVQKIASPDETIRLEHLPAGMYLFCLEKEGKVKTVKVIRE